MLVFSSMGQLDQDMILQIDQFIRYRGCSFQCHATRVA